MYRLIDAPPRVLRGVNDARIASRPDIFPKWTASLWAGVTRADSVARPEHQHQLGVRPQVMAARTAGSRVSARAMSGR
ncbi:MAG: hypothetical protein ACRDS9_26210, partial [Pseudonocardiaceae bacterium]